MSIKGLLFRFCLGYALAIVIGGGAARLFDLKQIPGANIGILFAAALYATVAFGTRNRRLFQRIEKWQAVGGMVFADLIVQTTLAWSAAPPPSVFPFAIPGMSLVMLAHSAVILGALGFSEKILAKQLLALDASDPASGGQA